MGTVKYEVGDLVLVNNDDGSNEFILGHIPKAEVDRFAAEYQSGVDAKSDPINPAHYRAGRVQVIEVSRLMGFDVGNAVKYLARAGKKDPSRELEDLRKAEWYLTDAIEHCEVADWDDAPEDLDDAVDAIVEGLTYLRAKAIKHAVEAELEDALECVRRELARLEGK